MQYINQRLLNELEQRVKQQEHTIQQLLRIVANLNKNVVQLSSEQKEKNTKVVIYVLLYARLPRKIASFRTEIIVSVLFLYLKPENHLEACLHDRI